MCLPVAFRVQALVNISGEIGDKPNKVFRVSPAGPLGAYRNGPVLGAVAGVVVTRTAPLRRLV